MNDKLCAKAIIIILNVPLFDQKSHFLEDFVPIFATLRLGRMPTFISSIYPVIVEDGQLVASVTEFKGWCVQGE